MNSRGSEPNFIERVTTDAVQRRLLRKRNNKNPSPPDKQINYYVCEQCNSKVNSLNGLDGLRSHFSEVKHNIIHHCVYCLKPVYKYAYKKGNFVYHECQYD